MKTFSAKTLDEKIQFVAELVGAMLIDFNIEDEESVRAKFNDEEKVLNFRQFLIEENPLPEEESDFKKISETLGDRI